MVSYDPIPRGGPSVPNFLHLLNMRTQYEKQPNLPWRSCEAKFLHGRPRMLTLDLFAVANRLLYFIAVAQFLQNFLILLFFCVS